jgi:hypothetical protein
MRICLISIFLLSLAGCSNNSSEQANAHEIQSVHTKINPLDTLSVSALTKLYYCDSPDSLCVNTSKDSITFRLFKLAKLGNEEAVLYLSSSYLSRRILPSADTANAFLNDLRYLCDKDACQACIILSDYYDRCIDEDRFLSYFHKLEKCDDCYIRFQYLYYNLNREFFQGSALPHNYPKLQKVSRDDLIHSISILSENGCSYASLFMMYYYAKKGDSKTASKYQALFYNSKDYDEFSKINPGITDLDPGFKFGDN